MPVIRRRRTRSLASELREARPGKPRRRIVARLVTELAGRLWAPAGVPYWRAVAIPPTLVTELRGARPRDQLDPGSRELVAMCRGVVRLANALTAGDEHAAKRALKSLSDPPRR